MDLISLFLVLSITLTSIYVFMSSSGGRTGGTIQLPPGPNPLPVIGNILALGKSPHISLTRLSKIYGPLMSLKLGMKTTIVVSSPKLAKEVLQKHDRVLSGRPIPASILVLGHRDFSIEWLPVSDQWRNLRKICKERIFSIQSLDSTLSLRQQKVRQLIDYVEESCQNGRAVDIGEAAFTTIVNVLSNILLSADLAQHGSSKELKNLVWAIMELFSKPNPVDFFPVLKLIDPLGINRKMKSCMEKLFLMFDKIIYEKESQRKAAYPGRLSASMDFLDSLLNRDKESDTPLMSTDEIKHLLLDLFIGGTDTNSSTVEWGMSELLKSPDKLTKARAELKDIIGKDGTMQESYIPRLPYLQAVVKETLRLHPPGPFMIPHKAEADTEISGYLVPKNAEVLVNNWGMGRDPDIWSDPDSFIPERFLDQQIDFKGKHFELISFGSGRRMCPGMPLAYRMLHLILGSLLLSYDWKLEEGEEDLDMSEQFGLTLQKAIPLKAIPIQG